MNIKYLVILSVTFSSTAFSQELPPAQTVFFEQDSFIQPELLLKKTVDKDLKLSTLPPNSSLEDYINQAIIHKDWKLCFQWCQYIYENGTSEFGYRFIWRDELNRLRPQRGQARIPTFKEMDTLLDEAKIDGWLEKFEKV